MVFHYDEIYIWTIFSSNNYQFLFQIHNNDLLKLHILFSIIYHWCYEIQSHEKPRETLTVSFEETGIFKAGNNWIDKNKIEILHFTSCSRLRSFLWARTGGETWNSLFILTHSIDPNVIKLIWWWSWLSWIHIVVFTFVCRSLLCMIIIAWIKPYLYF